MADRTIVVKPLPQHVTEEEIRTVFHKFNVSRVAKLEDTAYVEFQNAADLESVSFAFDN